MSRYMPYDQYVIATALALAGRHRPVWSWRKWRKLCRCGNDLPCQSRHRLPIQRDSWPTWNAPTQVLPRTGPLMTLAAEWRSSCGARRR